LHSRVEYRDLQESRIETTDPMRTKKNFFALLVLGVAGLTLELGTAASDDPPRTARYYRQQAAAAYKAKDYAVAIDKLRLLCECSTHRFFRLTLLRLAT